MSAPRCNAVAMAEGAFTGWQPPSALLSLTRNLVAPLATGLSLSGASVMARKHPPSVMLSSHPEDKRCACLNHEWTAEAYALAPDYFDVCGRWSSLTARSRLGHDLVSSSVRSS
jgi:hypothetical protein